MKTMNIRLVSSEGKPDQVMTLEEFSARHAEEQRQMLEDCARGIQEVFDACGAGQIELLAKGMEDGLKG